MGGKVHQIAHTALGSEFWREHLRIASTQTKDQHGPHIPQECRLEIRMQLIQILVGENHPEMVFACLREEFDHRGRGHEVRFIDIEKVITSLRLGALGTAECGHLHLVHQE